MEQFKRHISDCPGAMASYAGAWALEEVDFAKDPEYQAFKREMLDRGFGREPN